MEPFEWMVLGIGLAVGGLMGANSKGVMRTAARGYLAVGEKTREWTGNMREDFEDALEEARFEREESEKEEEREEEPEENGHARKRPTSARSRASGNSRATSARGSSAAKSASAGNSEDA